jgi:hypothetical protein
MAGKVDGPLICLKLACPPVVLLLLFWTVSVGSVVSIEAGTVKDIRSNKTDGEASISTLGGHGRRANDLLFLI